ncbi:MAG: glutamate--tRNA ligase [Ignavibacteriaceae bacterium]
MISEIVRVRFAPSPTGYLHIGGLRTALYNYLFAKHHNGKFILRIEDTDRNRFVEDAVENLITTLNWIGLNYDEGPDSEGEYGPYLQSHRLDIYKKYAHQLIENKKAYYCFCTPERLQELREEQQRQKLPQAKYDKHCLNISADEINQKVEAGVPHVIRLNVPSDQKIIFDDIIREKVEFDTANIDDQVLIKSDGFPTYHLANVVDDHLMKITHVIRGEEWLSSTPKHILLYDFFGWGKPVFAHLPLLLNPDRSKLSKRQGDVAVEDYQSKGYLKEALINFVALLGWNAGDDKEFYYLDELLEKFSLERVNKAGAVLDLQKLNWLNAEHLRAKPDTDILLMLKVEIQKSQFSNRNYSDDYLIQIIKAMKERVSFIKEFISGAPYFFSAPESYEDEIVRKRWNSDSSEILNRLADIYSVYENPSKQDFENGLKSLAEAEHIGVGKIIHPLRLAVSGMGNGPGVYDIVNIIGKEETIIRIKKAIEILK